ncbi:glycine/D-amino acid oxidase-like deaminating enzyme [Sphingomonas sp. BK036]|uniref:tryptophan halogenase family protein n=1 Tax=Sphingomonas sp. BK036 TaxID=2512122 RepID=UPI001029C3B5|nr:tryptophan halogenase family protein [Sphingomonas sp. BK036]RZT46158.1 glycine/D-amino acid oxidase-like deaminating enzyme [Sphingomonas sp. BK036]
MSHADVNEEAIRTVIVVGGGSAGWLTACRLAARSVSSGSKVKVLLVESATVPSVGVGEGTWPTMRNTLRKIGIDETDFIRSCDAALKQGAQFVGWTDGSAGDAYYHPLNPPAGAGDIDLSPYWLHASATETGMGTDAPAQVGASRASFADWVDYQSALCDAGLAPKTITAPEYGGQANYAYHLDAGKFATLLCNHATTSLGVEHVVGDVVRANLKGNGDIRNVELADGRILAGDLFVDCSGFAALLIGGVYDVPFRSCRDILFADRALAMQVPYQGEDDPIACHTISTAQDAGWIWNIGLWTRRGVGHVYSSAHTSDDEAEAALRRYVGPASDALPVRRISFEAGHRERFWQNNCVAIGLSAGFLEPLEASALMLIETSLDSLVDRLPQTRSTMDAIARQFNATFSHHWQRIIEFLKLHYAITHRRDTAFWRDNAAPTSMPEGLRERLALWKHHAPAAQDFAHAREVFSWPSYQYVLHGMRFASSYRGEPATADGKLVDSLVARNARVRAELVRKMPRHRDLLRAVREHGLQRV